jgi:hypothetical protein
MAHSKPKRTLSAIVFVPPMGTGLNDMELKKIDTG